MARHAATAHADVILRTICLCSLCLRKLSRVQQIRCRRSKTRSAAVKVNSGAVASGRSRSPEANRITVSSVLAAAAAKTKSLFLVCRFEQPDLIAQGEA